MKHYYALLPILVPPIVAAQTEKTDDSCPVGYAFIHGDASSYPTSEPGVPTTPSFVDGTSTPPAMSSHPMTFENVPFSTNVGTPATLQTALSATGSLNTIPSALSNGCPQTHTVVTGDTCDSLVKQYNIDLETLYTLNPSLDSSGQCKNLLIGCTYCVGGSPGQAASLSTTSMERALTKSTLSFLTQTITQAASLATPSAGGNPSCGSMSTITSGDNCANVAAQHGISLSVFYSLNPMINTKCGNLLANEAYCVQPADKTAAPSSGGIFLAAPSSVVPPSAAVPSAVSLESISSTAALSNPLVTLTATFTEYVSVSSVSDSSNAPALQSSITPSVSINTPAAAGTGTGTELETRPGIHITAPLNAFSAPALFRRNHEEQNSSSSNAKQSFSHAPPPRASTAKHKAAATRTPLPLDAGIPISSSHPPHPHAPAGHLHLHRHPFSRHPSLSFPHLPPPQTSPLAKRATTPLPAEQDRKNWKPKQTAANATQTGGADYIVARPMGSIGAAGWALVVLFVVVGVVRGVGAVV